MKIHVGSLNPTKIQAVKNLLENHPQFGETEIVGVDAQVEEFGHPKTMGEVIKGAKDRAKSVFDGSDLSIGIESGLFVVPDAKSGYIEVTVCTIFNGEDFFLGFGPAFEWPPKVLELILKGQDGSQAYKTLGLTTHSKLGVENGIIYDLTLGKMDRTKLNEASIIMALVHLERADLYKSS